MRPGTTTGLMALPAMQGIVRTALTRLLTMRDY
jgi:hypothetical protein